MNGTDWIMPYSQRKIFPLLDGRLFGFAGDVFKRDEFLSWLSTPEMTPINRQTRAGGLCAVRAPQPDLSDAAEVIVVELNGLVWLYQGQGRFLVDGPFCAIGCGRVAALAAMHAGCDAKRAIEIAALLDPFTGDGVDVLELMLPRMGG